MKMCKPWLADLLAVLLFAVLAFAYFFPADIEGRILYNNDSSAGVGAGREMSEHLERTGEVTRWTNSLFCGMPTYQMGPAYGSNEVLNAAEAAYHLWLPVNVWYVFAYLLGFYILLRAFDFRRSLAALGSVIWAFSSYFFIIIAAGHIWKVMALAYLPPMIAGMVLAYRGKYLWGLVVLSVFTALEIKANHVQMTYYYLFIILFMVVAYLVEALRRKQLTHFLKATAVCAAGALIGLSINLSNLYHTWQYSQESMRGKSELVKANAANQTDSGLERDYITQWSYGIGETWTLLVPNAKGGATVPLVYSKTAMEKADNNFLDIYQQMGQYWGNQPGTSGPVYVGAFVLMLFVLGLFIVKGPMKWALLGATVLSVLLSWGHNFMPFTDFFIDHVPMYSKFRTVASILVIAEFTIPLLAMLALKKIVDEPETLAANIKYVYVSFGLTGGLALLFALMPSMFFQDFVSVREMSQLSRLPAEYINPLLGNLKEMRMAVFTADCWRSFWIIVAGTLFLFLFKMRKMKAEYMIAAMTVLCLVDMWQVNKRYLNDGMFVNKSVSETPIQLTPTDEIILQDRDNCGNHRVLNLSTNTFNENETSYYHKSIGGYHAAKLRRYQELAEAYIMPEMGRVMKAIAEAGGDMTQVNGDSVCPVLNMLNTKYFIVPLQDNKTIPLQNPYTYGNAWFVDKIIYVDNANDEISAIGKINLRHEAVADKKFKEQLGETKVQDNTSVVNITQCEPNHLKYSVKSAAGGIVVFSEVYYPGWTATIDGKPAELGRVNYILRALNVGAGSHEVELDFHPQSISVTETVAYVACALLMTVIVLMVLLNGRNKRKKQ